MAILYEIKQKETLDKLFDENLEIPYNQRTLS